jgi:hypothetical protein
MAKKNKNGWPDVWIRVLETFEFFGGSANKNLKTNFAFDMLATGIGLVILYFTVPMINDLKLPLKGVIIFGYIAIVVYNLPYRAFKDCRRLFLYMLKKKDLYEQETI